MGIESGIVARLNAVTALTDLIGNRIYADVLPLEVDRPAIAYQMISNVPTGGLSDDSAIQDARIQITVVADQDQKILTIQVANAVKNALRRFRGVSDDVTIRDIRLENELDQGYESDTKIVARILDFKAFYE